MELNKNDFVKYKIWENNTIKESVGIILNRRGSIYKIIDIKNKNILKINLNLEKIYKLSPLEVELM